MHRLLTAGLVLSSLAFLFVTSASAEAISAFVDDISGGSARFDAVPQAGFGFYANASGTEKINCLGFYDAANGESGFVGDGLQAAHNVALLEFDGSNRVVIAEATIPAGDEATLSGGYRWVSIPEVTLDYTAQGADYYVLVASQGVNAWSDGGVTAEAGQTFGTLTGNGWSTGAAIPGVGEADPVTPTIGNPYGGANMGYAVPEPSTLALLVAGLIGLSACAWRKQR